MSQSEYGIQVGGVHRLALVGWMTCGWLLRALGRLGGGIEGWGMQVDRGWLLDAWALGAGWLLDDVQVGCVQVRRGLAANSCGCSGRTSACWRRSPPRRAGARCWLSRVDSGAGIQVQGAEGLVGALLYGCWW